MAEVRTRKVKLDKSFQLEGTVLFLQTGESKRGEDYYIAKIGGFTFFLEREFYKAIKEGDRVLVKGVWESDRWNRGKNAYEPSFDIEEIEVLTDQDVQHESSTNGVIPRVNVNGNGVKQPAPA